MKTAFSRSDIGSVVLKIAPPTFKCGSSASRAMNRRMISLEPSKIMLIRQSRRKRSTGTPSSPRPRSDCGRFVTAAAADLHRFVGNFPRRFGRPHFAHGGFDSQIAGLAIDQTRSEKRDRFHRENVARHLGDFSGNRRMFPDWSAPLNSFARPFPANFEQPFR